MASRILSVFLALLPLSAAASSLPEEPADTLSRPVMNYDVSMHVWGSTGQLAPYYIMSNRHGRFTQGDGIMLDLKAERELNKEHRFEYGFGVEALAGWQSKVDYIRYDASSGELAVHGGNPAPLWLQQLWAGVKYRGVFLTAGMHENKRSIFNSRIGSGDLTFSTNSRPIPRLSAGFIDFQDIPLTKGWVQIEGEISWGKMTDGKWLENHYNYYNSFITTGIWMHYSRCYFRTNPEKPFSVTVGMQQATQFGGNTTWYRDGEQTGSSKNSPRIKDFINALFPWVGGTSVSSGDKAYYDGNHLGSWDLRLRYRLPSGHEFTAYMQSPWEDGSGIGKLNGFDGVWGLEYRAPDSHAVLSGFVAEYLDFTNQSGPMHWAPGDFPGTGIPSQATGADDYYNNFMYNGWANYGLAIGSPFMKSPIYNTDGYMRFTDNRIRGFHLGAEGWLHSSLEWRAMFSFRTSWGTPLLPALKRTSDTSMLLEARWQVPAVTGLRLGGAVAWDAGRLLGNNFGAMLSISYSGIL